MPGSYQTQKILRGAVVAIVALLAGCAAGGQGEGSPPPDSRQSQLDAIVEQLPNGEMTRDIPSSIPLDTPTEARLVISPVSTREEIEEMLEEVRQDFARYEDLEFESITLGDRVRASLTPISGDIQVFGGSPDAVPMSFQDDNIWTWTLVANSPRRSALLLEIEMQVRLDGDESAYSPLWSRSYQIQVAAPLGARIAHFLREYWHWVATTVILPLLAFLGRRLFDRLVRRRRLDSDADPNQPN